MKDGNSAVAIPRRCSCRVFGLWCSQGFIVLVILQHFLEISPFLVPKFMHVRTGLWVFSPPKSCLRCYNWLLKLNKVLTTNVTYKLAHLWGSFNEWPMAVKAWHWIMWAHIVLIPSDDCLLFPTSTSVSPVRRSVLRQVCVRIEGNTGSGTSLLYLSSPCFWYSQTHFICAGFLYR